MFLLWLKLSATHILLPQQTYLNVIERKYKRQILMPDPIILAYTFGTLFLVHFQILYWICQDQWPRNSYVFSIYQSNAVHPQQPD